MIRTIALAALCASFGAAGCRGAAPGPVDASGAPRTPPGQTPADLKTLNLSYAKGSKPTVGSRVDAVAEGLPSGRPVDLLWETVDGGWVVENGYRFRGKHFTETTKPLTRAQVGADGRLEAHFTIPEDYGGMHAVKVVDAGVPIAQVGIEVSQSFEMTPSDGPVGTAIELRAKGLGWRTMESTWVVNWDNHELGWVSAADTRGTATARFRATGPAGPHLIKVYTGWQGQGYLNHEQSPVAHLPRPDFVFQVTGNGAVPPGHAEPYQKQSVPPVETTAAGSQLSLTPTQGPVLTRAVLKGSGFPANASLSLVWGTQAGSRVTDAGFAPKETDLGSVTVSADGRIEAPVTVPDDLGGLHSLSIRSGDKTLGRTFFVVETSVVSISPTSGPPGTPVTIHLKGVGWTDVDNIYVLTYDNAYMGYACGFNSQGDVVVNFTAAGVPGVHLIDFYPGIYQGQDFNQQLYRLPQLTYGEDHPGNKIPALRFAFEVTSGHTTR